MANLNITTLKHTQTVMQNTSNEDGCIRLVFSEMEYLPWNNPDNIFSAEDETLVRRIKNNALLLLSLIGGPANVINMAVFYKQGLKDRVNLCLFSLSLADELYLLTTMLHHGEQLYIQFTTKERFGPVTVFLANTNLTAVLGFGFVSPVLSAIIATERCLCVFNPLKFQTLMRTRTMAGVITVVYVVIMCLFFIVAFRFRVGCVHDPVFGITVITGIEGEFYRAHKEFIDRLDSFVFGVGLPGIEMIVVSVTTIMTIVKLRQIVSWRSETASVISTREVALTRMLVGNSILFIVCVSPCALIRFSWLFFPEVNSGRRNQNFFLSGLWVIEIMTFINSAFNICIYYIMGSRYRETFWSLFGRQSQSEKSGYMPSGQQVVKVSSIVQ